MYNALSWAHRADPQQERQDHQLDPPDPNTQPHERGRRTVTRNQEAVLVVVGDRFEGITHHTCARTLAQVVRMAQSDPECIPDTLILGQGIRGSDLLSLDAALNENHRRPLPKANFSRTQITSKKASHKLHSQNVLISNPIKTGTYTTRADLTIDNDNELLLDHQTGLHVQGMIAIEASRQMFLVSTTILHLIDDIEEPYFVIHEISTKFQSFLFPLPATLTFVTDEPGRSRADSVEFKAVIEILQNEVTASRTIVTYSVFKADRIQEIETKKAKQSIELLVSKNKSEA